MGTKRFITFLKIWVQFHVTQIIYISYTRIWFGEYNRYTYISNMILNEIVLHNFFYFHKSLTLRLKLVFGYKLFEYLICEWIKIQTFNYLVLKIWF